MIWQAIAEQQERVIEELCRLCDDLVARLAQHENIVKEERRLRELEEKEYGTGNNL